MKRGRPVDHAVPRLAAALALLGRTDPARRLIADDAPADAALLATDLARLAADAMPPELARTLIDDAETAVSRARGLGPDLRVALRLRLAELRRRLGDGDAAAKRRLVLAREIETLAPSDQLDVRFVLAETALAAGDTATADAQIAWSAGGDVLTRVPMVMIRVRRELARGQFAAATEPIWTEALAPRHIGYAAIVAAYRAAGKPDAAVDEILVQRACPRR